MIVNSIRRDREAFVEPPFASMEIEGQLLNYPCARITREGASMNTQTRTEIEKVMGSTMISILYDRIVRLER